MRAVIQRVSHASVSISGHIKGQIARGLLVLLAVEEADTAEDIEWLSGKIVRLKIFPDDEGLMNRSVQDVGGEILLISQFTLFASTNSCLDTGVPNKEETYFSVVHCCSFLRNGFRNDWKNPYFKPKVGNSAERTLRLTFSMRFASN